MDSLSTNSPQLTEAAIPTPEGLGQSPAAPPPPPDSEPAAPKRWPIRRWLKQSRLPVLLLLVIISGLLTLTHRAGQPPAGAGAGSFNAIQLALKNFAPEPSATATQSLKVNGQLQVSQSLIVNPSTEPAASTAGQLYYSQATNQLNYFNGSQYVPLGASNSTIQNTTNITNLGSSNVINATAGITAPTGTPGRLIKFTGAQTTGNSIAQDNTTHLQVNGGLDLVAANTASDLTLFAPTASPSTFDNTDAFNGPDVELGVKFQVDVAGVIKSIRFYKEPGQSGTFSGHLWTSTGALLGSVTFNVSGNGWQQADFAAPIPVSPDQTYVASYHNTTAAPNTPLGYAFDGGTFSASGVDNGPLHGLASGIDGGNGVFKYTTAPAIPDRTFNSTSYWVDVIFNGAIPTPDSRLRFNGAQITSNDLANDFNLAKRGSSQVFSGHNIFRNANDNTDAFSIQKANTVSLFSVSTSNARIFIGPAGGDATGTLLVLGNKLTSGDPAGTEGAIYYNLAQKMFRCYRDGEWSECATNAVDRGYEVYDEFLGGQTTSFTPNDNIGSLGWHATAIGANGSLDFNPASPMPVADRPGVLDLQTPAVANQGTTLMLGNASGGSAIVQAGDIIKTAVALDSATGSVLRIGLHGQTSGTGTPISGVWWEANPAADNHWLYCYGTGTSAVCSPSADIIIANTWTPLKINVSGTGTGTSEATFTVNGHSLAVTAVTIDSTNRVSPALSFYAGGAAARHVYWDYFQFKGTTSLTR